MTAEPPSTGRSNHSPRYSNRPPLPSPRRRPRPLPAPVRNSPPTWGYTPPRGHWPPPRPPAGPVFLSGHRSRGGGPPRISPRRRTFDPPRPITAGQRPYRPSLPCSNRSRRRPFENRGSRFERTPVRRRLFDRHGPGGVRMDSPAVEQLGGCSSRRSPPRCGSSPRRSAGACPVRGPRSATRAASCRAGRERRCSRSITGRGRGCAWSMAGCCRARAGGAGG